MNKKKLLIIDDDMTFLESIELMLISKNFDVVKTATGEFIFEMLMLEKPDLVLLERNMSGKNGFEVLKDIRSNESFSKLPIIMITGDSTVHIDELLAQGADNCVLKPFDIDELVNKMNKLLK
ncbi:MAG: response regulator [Endomicrobium sp.]|jgi:DNA-binding response OmpR family regulator|nr:response regulator [Endomicrobium sp.]